MCTMYSGLNTTRVAYKTKIDFKLTCLKHGRCFKHVFIVFKTLFGLNATLNTTEQEYLNTIGYVIDLT